MVQDGEYIQESEGDGVNREDIDVLIRGARVVDGTGNPWYYGDVAISGDRVLDVTPPNQVDDALVGEVVEAAGMVVCPGFIDIQSHSIVPLMIDGRCLSKIVQGVTTEIMGEGWTPAPFGGKIRDPLPSNAFVDRLPGWADEIRTWTRFRDWLESMARRGVSPNIGSFLGGGTLREFAKGMEMGLASPTELDEMRMVMAEAMEDGAFGVSYALIYPPDGFAGTAEIIEVCKVVAERRGVYITHIRSEAEELLNALDEAIQIGRSSGAPVEIYHLKAAGKQNWHRMEAAVAKINAARADGTDITADMYPYIASGTGLSAVLPPWASAGDGLYKNLRDAEMRSKIRRELERPSGDWEAMAYGSITQDIMLSLIHI